VCAVQTGSDAGRAAPLNAAANTVVCTESTQMLSSLFGLTPSPVLPRDTRLPPAARSHGDICSLGWRSTVPTHVACVTTSYSDISQHCPRPCNIGRRTGTVVSRPVTVMSTSMKYMSRNRPFFAALLGVNSVRHQSFPSATATRPR